MAKKDIHPILQQNRKSYDSKKGEYRDDFYQRSGNAFIEYGFFEVIGYKEYQLYEAIYSEVDPETNEVQRSLMYWAKKINNEVPKDEDDKKRIQKKMSKLVCELVKKGFITVKHGAPHTEADSTKIGSRDYSIYSIRSFEDALSIQVKMGLRPAEDLRLIGRSGSSTTLNVYENIKTPEAEQKEPIVEEKKEDIEVKNQPTREMEEAYYQQKAEELKANKTNLIGKSKERANINLVKQDAHYMHPMLVGAKAPITIQDKETGEFQTTYPEPEPKTSFTVKELVEYFYEECRIPEGQRQLQRDIGGIWNLLETIIYPQAIENRIPTLDLALFLVSRAGSASHAEDKKIGSIFDLEQYMDYALMTYREKKNTFVLSQEEIVDVPVEEPSGDIAAEEMAQAEEEYSFLNPEQKAAMMDIIRRHGYKPGYSEDLMATMAWCQQNNKPFEINGYTEKDYKSRYTF